MRIRPTHALLFVSSLILLVTSVQCWENYELDLFDLVEEVGQNFYEYFGVKQDCDNKELRQTYRKLSLLWHPDKNTDEGAELKFRHIVAINEVLKDSVKRDRYNKILENGMPDWRMPVYYFRRARKMSFLEISIAISIIATIGHYFVMWAQYFEHRMVLDEKMTDVRKKLDAKQKKRKQCPGLDRMDEQLQQMCDDMPSPSMRNTIPVRLSAWLFQFALSVPTLIKDRLTKKPVEIDQSDSEEESDSSFEKHKANKRAESERLRKGLNPTKIEKSGIAAVVSSRNNELDQLDQMIAKSNSSKEWSDKEKSDLIRAVSKYPPGSLNRWQKVSEFVGSRTAGDCIAQEKLMKSNITSQGQQQSASNTWNQMNATDNSADDLNDATSKISLRTQADTVADLWSQEQQDLFQKSLKDINKDTPNRWERIAECVPDKNKEDCLNRFKILCAALKKKWIYF